MLLKNSILQVSTRPTYQRVRPSNLCLRWLRRLAFPDKVSASCIALNRRQISQGAFYDGKNVLSSSNFFFYNAFERQRHLQQSSERPRDALLSGQALKDANPALRPDPYLPARPPLAGSFTEHRKSRRRLQDNTELDTVATPMSTLKLKKICSALLALSKPRLTFLMVLTTTTAYSLFPVAISPMASTLSLSSFTLLNLTLGTAMSSASANAFNMTLEPKHDAKMTRTRTRPLVRGLIGRRTALLFAISSGVLGLAILYNGVNPTVAWLSASNIGLYAAVYTPLKRVSVINTWVGAIVGSIPPLMGWAAAAGQAMCGESLNGAHTTQDLLFDPATSAGGWLLAALLFAWQFPHFNALSHTIRHEYAAAGFKMLASVNTARNARVAFRYTLTMFPICAGLCAFGVTTWYFLLPSSLANGWLTREAFIFWRRQGAGDSARRLFWASNWHLAVVLVMAMVCKNGMWERLMKGGLDDQEFEEFAHGEWVNR